MVHILRGDSSDTDAARVIDVVSKVVCPGFIDMRTPSGLVILADPEHHPKVRHGVNASHLSGSFIPNVPGCGIEIGSGNQSIFRPQIGSPSSETPTCSTVAYIAKKYGRTFFIHQYALPFDHPPVAQALIRWWAMAMRPGTTRSSLVPSSARSTSSR